MKKSYHSIVVPTVAAMTPLASCALCSTSESWPCDVMTPMVVSFPVVVIILRDYWPRDCHNDIFYALQQEVSCKSMASRVFRPPQSQSQIGHIKLWNQTG